MKSIAITYPFPLGKPNGGARMTREIARHLGKRGIDVVLLPVSASAWTTYPRAVVADKFLGREFDDELTDESVEIVRVSQHPISWRCDALRVRSAVERLLERKSVDAVLSYYHEGAALPSFLAARGIPFGFISTWQTYTVVSRVRWKRLGISLVRTGFDNMSVVRPHRRAQVLFATSNHTRGQLIDVLGVDPDRIELCYLGVDPNLADIPRRSAGEIRRFLFFGRICAVKGVGDAIRALGRIAKDGRTDWEFRVIGDGEHDWAKGLAERHGIADRVAVSGPMNDHGLRRELELADVALMPSHYEAFGLSIAESQAAGLPVIGYAAGSVPELVKHGETGWLAPRLDVDRLTSHLREALEDPDGTRRVGRAARERATSTFTWENTAETIARGLERIA